MSLRVEKVQTLAEGHTVRLITAHGSIEHAYILGGTKETITWTQKTMAKEVAAQLKRHLQSRSIYINRIARNRSPPPPRGAPAKQDIP